MRLAVLSNVTADVLARMLEPEHELWLASGFGAWMETALLAPDELKAFAPAAVVLLLDVSRGAVDPVAIERAVTALEAALPQTSVLVPDLADLADALETNARSVRFYDDRMWKIGAMPWSIAGLRAIRDEIVRLLGLLKGGRKKVLAVDFDNVLWEGVVGEGGVEAIRPRVEFQRGLRDLRARGVLLAGFSKNNASDVEPVWSDPRMVLKKDDFVDLRVDWSEKADNLDACARALNLGTDAFVFVDDNPAERAQMAVRHPEVAVPDWPVSVRRLARLYFPRMRLTDEDRSRTERYRAECRRRESAAGLSFDDYLKGLEIRTEVHPIVPSEFARVAQLSQKVNQFNVCTNRFTTEDIARFAADPSHLILTLQASDRFGDLGLVAFVHAVRATSSALVLDWVMSCRAMNRRIEFELERNLEEELARRGVRELRATWRRTAKNGPVCNLFETFGFAVTDRSEDEKSYVRPIENRRRSP